MTVQTQDDAIRAGQQSLDHRSYGVPTGPLRLSGPVDRPPPGALPLRGDLAHIALAQRYLVQNYVCPTPRTVGAADTAMLLNAHDGAEQVVRLSAGSPIELLDEVGAWAWVCRGPEGPAGFVRLSALAPAL